MTGIVKKILLSSGIAFSALAGNALPPEDSIKAVKKQVDLSSLLPDLKECTLTPQEDSKLLLQVNDGKNSFSHELSAAEIHQLQKTLTDSGLSDEEKRQQIGRMVNNIMLTRQVSLNYEQGASEQQSQSENRQIR